MDKSKIITCLDEIQRQIDVIRKMVLQNPDSNISTSDDDTHGTIYSEDQMTKLSQEQTEISVLPREEQFRERIASLLLLASSQNNEEDLLEGLRKVIHSDTSSNDVALRRLQRFNFSRLQQQYAQYLQDPNDFFSFIIEREDKREFSTIVEYKVFVLANVRKPVPLTFRMDAKNQQWMIYSFSL